MSAYRQVHHPSFSHDAPDHSRSQCTLGDVPGKFMMFVDCDGVLLWLESGYIRLYELLYNNIPANMQGCKLLLSTKNNTCYSIPFIDVSVSFCSKWADFATANYPPWLPLMDALRARVRLLI
ncbi:unnamed protein product [Periconia digitata]|uniref:Uncharacterized protein n=1 Tax=Periconia digitata TaxID=1303443 RepID=A0A9W4U824_9PLEO|nr:unnamed protein product [Periconia digitata]